MNLTAHCEKRAGGDTSLCKPLRQGQGRPNQLWLISTSSPLLDVSDYAYTGGFATEAIATKRNCMEHPKSTNFYTTFLGDGQWRTTY